MPAGSGSTGEDVTRLPPYRRPLNTVFQNYALFPHMSVAGERRLRAAPAGRREGEAARARDEALELVGLAGFGDRLPRAAFRRPAAARRAGARHRQPAASCCCSTSRSSALDLKLRKQMQIELKQLQHQLGIAFVFVTHDQEEAMTMADRIVVMNGGRIEQIGRGQDIYARPATRFVADFIGEANLLAVKRRGDGSLSPAGRRRSPFRRRTYPQAQAHRCAAARGYPRHDGARRRGMSPCRRSCRRHHPCRQPCLGRAGRRAAPS